jgi:hypothetical protein
MDNSLVSPDTLSVSSATVPSLANWYLGIDFGATGISATLLNSSKGELYPLAWQVSAKDRENYSVSPPLINDRLPSVVQLKIEEKFDKLPPVLAVGYPVKTGDIKAFCLQNFKGPLKIAIPYKTTAATSYLDGLDDLPEKYEPLLQWTQGYSLPLIAFFEAINVLLNTLNPQSSRFSILSIDDKLDGETLVYALQNLEGVIMGFPLGWSQAYQVNLKEAVLASGLVKDVGKIFMIEDSIASLLSELSQNKNTKNPLKGGTLVINAGATTIELALVDLPENPQENLSYSHFHCASFGYGGNAIEQDIICQVLMKDELFGYWENIPRPGYPDLGARYQLQRWLQSSPFGLALIEAAKYLKLRLSQQDTFTLKIGKHRWDVKRRDIELKVLVPFIQQLNRELNDLLSRVGISTVAINQGIFTGGTSAIGAIARWLRQKLPNAILIQNSPAQVALGFASLPLYPKILSLANQPYKNDYFLLRELLEIFGENSLGLTEINQRLEKRGINTHACSGTILRLLEGELPLGLLPSEEDSILLTQESVNNRDYQLIKSNPLFAKNVEENYNLNLEQRDIILQYMNRLMVSREKGLQEPLTIDDF